MPIVSRHRPGTMHMFAVVFTRGLPLCSKLARYMKNRMERPMAIARLDPTSVKAGFRNRYTVIIAIETVEPIMRPKHPEQNTIPPKAILWL